MSRNIYLASKPRYEILDGLRGVAAMLVVAYHRPALHPEQGHQLLEAVRVGQGTFPQPGGLQARLPVPPALHTPVQEGGWHDT